MLYRSFLGGFAILLLVFFAASAAAQAHHEPAGAKPGEAAPVEEAAKHEAGKAKANIWEGWLDLSIWTIVVFLVLFFVLKRYAWGPMLEGLENREKRIHGELEQAQKANVEAQALRGEFEKKINEAQQQVRDLIDRARKDGEQLKVEMVSQATAQIQAEKDRARRELQLEKEQALVELYQRSTQLAALMSTKAIRRQLNIDDQHRLVEEALNDLGVAANERQRVLASIQ
jgi:F-type H+-transporting ATPase subunit b